LRGEDATPRAFGGKREGETTREGKDEFMGGQRATATGNTWRKIQRNELGGNMVKCETSGS